MLFESCVLATALAFAKPADPSGKTMYPSGAKDVDNVIFPAPPISVYPLLIIGSPIYLRDGSAIFPGNYCVKPSIDESQILIIQGADIFCECRVVENTIVSDFMAKPIVKINTVGQKLILTYQIENILKKAEIPIK